MEIVTYFQLERAWTWGLAVLGLLGLVLAGYLWLARGAWRGAALPIGIFAIIEIAVGVSVALRSPAQAAELVRRADAGEDLGPERVRIDGVARTFAILKIAELMLFAAGVVVIYGLRGSSFAVAVGLGVIVQCSALFAFDLVASRRAEVYRDALYAMPASKAR
jgi:MFS family permease